MHTPWIGPRKIVVIPAIVNDPQYISPPSNWVSLIQQRLFFDPDPNTGADRSLRSYIHTISYGKALLEADVVNPVTVQPCDINATIESCPTSHLYEYACLVFMGGTHGCGGWAFWHTLFPYNPPRSPNNMRNWCRVNMGESLGIWAMEVMHMTTSFGDLYNTNPHPGNFDNMACSCGTHPSTYTKLKLGWLDPNDVPTVSYGSTTNFTLHALALLQPPPPGRVTAVRIPSKISQHYYLVEARLRADHYERATPGISNGIPSEGVVVYEVNEAAWPVRLRTPAALTVGQMYSNPAEQLDIEVIAAVPGGFTVSIKYPENPKCASLRESITQAEDENDYLQEELRSAAPGAKPRIAARIKRLQAQIRRERQEAINLGCRLH
jgi:hypothetical protein